MCEAFSADACARSSSGTWALSMFCWIHLYCTFFFNTYSLSVVFFTKQQCANPSSPKKLPAWTTYASPEPPQQKHVFLLRRLQAPPPEKRVGLLALCASTVCKRWEYKQTERKHWIAKQKTFLSTWTLSYFDVAFTGRTILHIGPSSSHLPPAWKKDNSCVATSEVLHLLYYPMHHCEVAPSTETQGVICGCLVCSSIPSRQQHTAPLLDKTNTVFTTSICTVGKLQYQKCA